MNGTCRCFPVTQITRHIFHSIDICCCMGYLVIHVGLRKLTSTVNNILTFTILPNYFQTMRSVTCMYGRYV